MKPPITRLPSQTRICFVGESFVNGTGDPECLGWTGRICVDAHQQGYDITYYNLGVRGETTAQLKERWYGEVVYRLPTELVSEYDGRVVFCFGVNDTAIANGNRRVSLLNTIFNTREILSRAQELYPVLFVGPPPMLDNDQNTRIAELSMYFGRICRELGIPYLDIFPILKQSTIWFDEIHGYDGSHPRSRGYQEFANIVKAWDGWKQWFPLKV